MSNQINKVALSTLRVFFLIIILVFAIWGCYTYKVWQKGRFGDAQLMEYQQNRQIAFEETQARLETLGY